MSESKRKPKTGAGLLSSTFDTAPAPPAAAEQTTMTVYVTHVRQEGSVSVGYGTDEAGKPVLFAGDSRMMADLAARLADDGQPVPVTIEPWQLMAGGGAA